MCVRYTCTNDRRCISSQGCPGVKRVDKTAGPHHDPPASIRGGHPAPALVLFVRGHALTPCREAREARERPWRLNPSSSALRAGPVHRLQLLKVPHRTSQQWHTPRAGRQRNVSALEARCNSPPSLQGTHPHKRSLRPRVLRALIHDSSLGPIGHHGGSLLRGSSMRCASRNGL